MDYSEFYKIGLKVAEAQGIPSEYITRHETLYYDETGNIKHLCVKGQKLNSTDELFFVLGGVQAEDSISTSDLFNFMGKQSEGELKSTKDINGDFLELLGKKRVQKTLELIKTRGWHIHFSVVQIFYYAFVDIIDSIDKLRTDPILYKALLYKPLRNAPDKTFNHFKTFKYPNVKRGEIFGFINGLLEIIDDYIKKHPRICPIEMEMLREGVASAKQQEEMVFLHDETTHLWVDDFTQFYRSDIYSYPNKNLIFDEEGKVEGELRGVEMTIDGKELKNYKFVASTDEPLIQLSDYVVHILKKYFVFLEKEMWDVMSIVRQFNQEQLNTFKLLNIVLMDSLMYNPMFLHYTTSMEFKSKVDYFIFNH